MKKNKSGINYSVAKECTLQKVISEISEESDDADNTEFLHEISEKK